jgi:hypothetical protein
MELHRNFVLLYNSQDLSNLSNNMSDDRGLLCVSNKRKAKTHSFSRVFENGLLSLLK